MVDGRLKEGPPDVGACPSIGAGAAAATRAAGQILAALPGSWQAAIPPLGDASFTVAGIDGAPPGSEVVVLSLARGRERGRAALAQPFAGRLVDLAVGGGGAFSTARALGPAERGLLVGLLAPALDPIGWSFALAPASAAPWGPSIAVDVSGAFGAGVLWLELPDAPAAALTGAWRARAAALPVEASVELASTALPAGELARLMAGDAVVFDGIPFARFDADADWEATLALGGTCAGLRIDPRGALALAGDFRLTDAPDRPKVGVRQESEEGKVATMDASGPSEAATAALAAAPVEIVAELARLTLRGDEVLGLAPGVVLAPTIDRRRAVVLRAGGEPWAEGELVDVDGELAVRVTRLLRP
jgi:type III secretion system YscQ/HrcQ family protein